MNSHSSTPLAIPSDGIPEVYSSSEGFSIAASRLNDGTGPVALDTERAGEFRYDDRAFLIQLRREGSGTILIAPEHHRQECGKILAPVLNQLTWVMHSACTDLPSLSVLSLHPDTLFDTELAGRLAGFSHVNLAAMVDRVLGFSLSKGHGREDWSRPHLPRDWIIYAALDVELLLPLADAMAHILDSQGKLAWAKEEFNYVIEHFSSPQQLRTERDWTALKGIRTLKTPQQLAMAAYLWKRREEYARKNDLSPQRVLPRKALLSIARHLPTTVRSFRSLPDMWQLKRVNASVNRWWNIYSAAQPEPVQLPPNTAAGFPSPATWKKAHEHSWQQYQSIHKALEDLADRLDIPLQNIIAPSALKALVWHHSIQPPTTSEQIIAAARSHDVRDWQINLTLPILRKHLIDQET